MAQFISFVGKEITQQEISLKQLLPGVDSGTVYQDIKANFMLGESRIAPNGTIPAHKGNQESVFIVVTGSGTVFTESEDGEVLAQTAVKAGDVLLYTAPFFKHRYEAGDSGLAYMVVPVPKAKQE